MKKVIVIFFAIIGLIAAGLLIWLATLDGKIEVEKTITVNSPVESAYKTVADFNSWPQWSPWLCMEPNAKISVSNEGTKQGDIYTWNGELVGAGEIEHTSLEMNKSINQEIRFSKPFESSYKVFWNFEASTDSTTKITWGMNGEMPFLLRFTAKFMEPIIGMDYDRGLKMLKEFIETGKVNSEIEIVGLTAFNGFSYVGKTATCPMNEISTSMSETFKSLEELCSKDSLSYNKALTVYHNFDFTSTECNYTSGMPVPENYTTGDEGFNIGKLETTKVVKVILKGNYEHLGNAWSAAYAYINHKGLKPIKGADLFELYLTNPNEEPDPSKWITEVYIPVE